MFAQSADELARLHGSESIPHTHEQVLHASPSLHTPLHAPLLRGFLVAPFPDPALTFIEFLPNRLL